MRSAQRSPVASEKGVALVIVLLLLAVMSALTTGLAMSGQTEIAMASNEMYYAGARAAAEAGLNRATERIRADNTTNLIAGEDGLVDNVNANAAVNADNALVPGIGNGPFTIGSQYSYSLQIMDDDDDRLYPAALDALQLAQMGEDGFRFTSGNDRLILRAIGTGPRGTRVVLARVLESIVVLHTTQTTTPGSNPALLVDGDLQLNNNVNVVGTQGNIHANGSITGGADNISGNVTATGTIDDRIDPGGIVGENQFPVTVPEIRAADYKSLADWVLKSDGTITTGAGVECGSTLLPCPGEWDFKSNGWKTSGKSMPPAATYYVEGPAEIDGVGSSSTTNLSVIAEGSIKINGNASFSPANDAKIQFVTNGDFESNADADDGDVDVDGQIMVAEQLKLQGHFEFRGRVVVKNRNGATNAYNATSNPHGRRGDDRLDDNRVVGNMTITYNGTLGATPDVIRTVDLAPTYNNNVTGWIEQ